MAKNLIVAVIALSICGVLAEGYVSCSPCDGSYVNSNLGTGCVAAVREKCAGLRSKPTTQWSRGINVKSNCNSIPVGTAIATFHGAGQTYNSGSYKHAAIFMGGCTSSGFKVHDQWVGKSGCSERRLPYGSSGVNGGDNFWTIN